VQTFRCEAEVVDLVKRHARRSLATIASEDGVPKVDDDLFCIDDDCAPVIRLLAEWFNIQLRIISEAEYRASPD
jgi:hypothetical protein